MSAITKVYVGQLHPKDTERDVEEEFGRFGKIRTAYIPRSSPNGGFAFVDFFDKIEAEDAVKNLDGFRGWKVEMAKPRRGDRERDSRRCYSCGEEGHFARDCSRARKDDYRDRKRSRSPRDRDRSPRDRGQRDYDRRDKYDRDDRDRDYRRDDRYRRNDRYDYKRDDRGDDRREEKYDRRDDKPYHREERFDSAREERNDMRGDDRHADSGNGGDNSRSPRRSRSISQEGGLR